MRSCTTQVLPLKTHLCAVLLVYFSTVHSFGATVAAIPSTAFVVVFVVTTSVCFILNQSARSRRLALVFWVDAFALQNAEHGGYENACNCAMQRYPSERYLAWLHAGTHTAKILLKSVPPCSTA